MNERRARNLLPRPSGVDPHSFTPPRLPPKLWVPAKAGAQRGGAAQPTDGSRPPTTYARTLTRPTSAAQDGS